MTLLKREEQEEKLNNQDVMKMEKFKQLVKDTYESLRYVRSTREQSQVQIVVASGNGKCNNQYVKFVVEYLFMNVGEGDFFNCTLKEYTERYGKSEDFYRRDWRIDIELCRTHPEKLSALLTYAKPYVNLRDNPNNTTIYTTFYNIFWNLFLTAIDDDIYNNQLSDVIDLAYIFGFDEHMICDCCHAVEYVLNGNRFSKDCNFEPKTVEGAYFFLGKNFDRR